MKRFVSIAALAAITACATASAGTGGAASSGAPTGGTTAPVTAGPAAQTGTAAAAAATITPDEMRAHIAYLASDALRGRDTPSPGLDSAAAYLVRHFQAMGLQGGAEGGAFIQRYPLRGSDALAPNVVAIFPGSDPALRNEYVVLSAHMDHVGVGRPVRGDSIYNGADDDASGTSALLEVAQAFVSMQQRPARSILFLAVSGEEKGLLGSEYFSDNPTVPLESIVANVNMDMIGRNERDTVVVIGKNYSSLGSVVERVSAEHPRLVGLAAGDDRWPREGFFFRSDQFNFARKEIPVIFFFAGTHEDYHEPSDEVETIDTDKAARVARMIFLTTHAIATDPQRPRWTESGLREVRRMTGGR